MITSSSLWAAPDPKIKPPKTVESSVDLTEDVSDRNYYEKIRYLIGTARKSIDLSLDTLAVSDKKPDAIEVLLGDLVDASKRGVWVRLFLNTFTQDNAYNEGIFLREDRLEFLTSQGGVHVHFINPQYHFTDRVLVFDQEIVMEGGLPWTDQGIRQGLGSATLINSKELAVKKVIRFEMLPLWDVQKAKNARVDGVLAIPLYLFKDIKYFPAMVKGDDGDAFRVYLALLKMSYENHQTEFPVPFDDLAGHIPSSPSMNKGAVIYQVIRALTRLQDDYNLIRIQSQEADSMVVELVLPHPVGAVIGAPLPFFNENYSKQISPRGLYTYFVIVYRLQLSGQSPVWLGSERSVEQDFPIQKEDFRLGVEELRRNNLVEIYPFHLKPGEAYQGLENFEYRYLVNEVTSLSERLAAWSQIREAFGEDALEKAKQAAEIFGEPEDMKVVLTYLDLLKQYAYEDIFSVTQHLAELQPQSTPALLDYLKTLLRNETRKDPGLAVA